MRKISLLLTLLLAASGCARAIERSEVSHRFNSLFACSSPHVVSESGGYRAEGCGVTAHFRCFDTPRPVEHHAHEGDGLGHAIADIAELSLDSDTCVLEHSERHQMPSERRPVERKQADGGFVRLKARALVKGGHVEAMGIPEKDAEHAILALHSIADMGAVPCEASLYRDGSRVPLAQIARVSDHEVRLAIQVRSLAGLDSAQRLAGSACGFAFELDAEGQKALSLFEVRFREELTRSHGSRSSGSEQPATQASAPTATTQQ